MADIPDLNISVGDTIDLDKIGKFHNTPIKKDKTTNTSAKEADFSKPEQSESNQSRKGGIINEKLKVRFSVSCFKYHQIDNKKRNDCVEVTFNNRRKQLFRNPDNVELNNFEYILVQVENGMDMGTVTACGRIAYDKYCQSYGDNPKKRLMPIIRIADQNDYENLKRNVEEENRAVAKTEELAERFGLEMKVTDADWQFDRQRLTVSFTAPQRIDFRLLVKELARTFRTRIELRQISTREEAKRIGGMGPCGRTLCCASIGGENCHVTLDHARVQQLSNNVAKLSGYCGRLKCCLLYEYPVYLEASKKFPPLNSRILLPEGEARVIKADIFKESVYVHIPKAGIYKSLTCEELDVLKENKKVLSPPNDNYHHHHNSKHEYDNNPEELKDLEKQ